MMVIKESLFHPSSKVMGHINNAAVPRIIPRAIAQVASVDRIVDICFFEPNVTNIFSD